MDHPAAAAAPHPAIATHTQLAYGALPQTPPPPALQQAGMATPYPPPPPQPIAQASPVVGAYSPALYQASAASQALSYQHLQQQHQQQLQDFWAGQMQEIEQVNDFKNHQLPLARIKKIMKADEDVRMISAEAPVLFAKACEMFILELTLRSWIHTEENKRRTLQKNDIAAAITRTDIFDFLVDIVPRDELKEEGLGMPRAADAIPYGGLYYVPQSQGPHRPDPNIYPQQQRMATMPYMPPQSVQQVWQQQQQPHIANTPPGPPPSSS